MAAPPFCGSLTPPLCWQQASCSPPPHQSCWQASLSQPCGQPCHPWHQGSPCSPAKRCPFFAVGFSGKPDGGDVDHAGSSACCFESSSLFCACCCICTSFLSSCISSGSARACCAASSGVVPDANDGDCWAGPGSQDGRDNIEGDLVGVKTWMKGSAGAICWRELMPCATWPISHGQHRLPRPWLFGWACLWGLLWCLP